MSYKNKLKYIIILLIISNLNVNSQNIQTSIEYIIKNYPEATLIDIYKSFFQDQFGLGHLVTDSLSAKEQLITEIEDNEIYSKLPIEPTGYLHQYYRVNLSLIKSGKIPFELFFQVFMESTKNDQQISLKQWKKEWKKILKVINTMNINFKEYRQDKKTIELLLKDGNYACHHSKIYNKLYHPHYRLIKASLISRLLTEEEIKDMTK